MQVNIFTLKSLGHILEIFYRFEMFNTVSSFCLAFFNLSL